MSTKRVKVILSLPRCGTHYVWSRFVDAGRQLVYDSDRIPALSTMAEISDEPLGFLTGAGVCRGNPNYNFQYNSLPLDSPALTARQHLDRLHEKYGTIDEQELFDRSMALQDNGDRDLFSVNRFIYTCDYTWMPGNQDWTIASAIKALRCLRNWYDQIDAEVSYAFVVRRIPDWLEAQLRMVSQQNRESVVQRLRDFPEVLTTMKDLGIPVFEMSEVISTIRRGILDFDTCASKLGEDGLHDMLADRDCWLERSDELRVVPPPPLRLSRLLQYMREREPVKRTSLVRSVGTIPKRLPGLKRRIQNDLDGHVLNNARILTSVEQAKSPTELDCV